MTDTGNKLTATQSSALRQKRAPSHLRKGPKVIEPKLAKDNIPGENAVFFSKSQEKKTVRQSLTPRSTGLFFMQSEMFLWAAPLRPPKLCRHPAHGHRPARGRNRRARRPLPSPTHSLESLSCRPAMRRLVAAAPLSPPTLPQGQRKRTPITFPITRRVSLPARPPAAGCGRRFAYRPRGIGDRKEANRPANRRHDP